MQVKLFLKFKSIPFDYLTPSEIQENSYPHCGTKGGGGVDGTSTLLGFLICCNFLKNNFALSGKPWIFFFGIFYGWWCCWRSLTSPNMVAILATILDFIKI